MNLFSSKNNKDRQQDYLDTVIQSLRVLGIYETTSVLVADEQKHIVFVNEHFKYDFGYDLSDVKNEHIDFLNSEMLDRAFYQRLNNTIESSKVFTDYIYLKTKYNKLIRSYLKIIPSQVKNTGQKYFLCTYDVIENNIGFENNLKESYKILMELVEQSPDIICIKDGDGKWLMANESDLLLFHLENVDYKGKTDAQLAFETHEIYRDAFLRCMDTDERCWQAGVLNRSDEIIPLPEGGQVVLDVLKIPVFNKDQSRKNLIVMGRDVTSFRKAEDELRAAKVKAEESDRLKTTFLATMSHELRTPLNAVIGFSNLIEADDDLEEIHGFSDVITKNAYSLLNIIEDLFDISLIEADQIQINLAEMDIIATIKDVFNTFSIDDYYLVNPDVRLLNLIKEDHFVVLSDMNRVKQIMINLLKNSVKFTQKGEISVGFEYDDQMVYIIVSDHGIGIDETKQKIIFDMFRQAHEGNDRKYGGVGIGLSISKKLAHKLGGDIKVSSEVGKGSQFVLSLPR